MAKIKVTALDKLFSKYMRLKNKGICAKCGGKPDPRGYHPHHIFTRAAKSTRWDEQNIVCLCYGCHSYAHRRPNDFRVWVEKHIGFQAYAELELRSKRPKKWTQIELDLFAEQLKREIKNPPPESK